MSLGSSLNASQSLTSSLQKQNNKQQANFFNKIQALSAELKEVGDRLHDLQEECISIREEKTSVEKYLEKKSEENRVRLMGELELFEAEVRRKIEEARRETVKIDERVDRLKQAQLYSLQMILAVQRRVQELEVQLGLQQQE